MTINEVKQQLLNLMSNGDDPAGIKLLAESYNILVNSESTMMWTKEVELRIEKERRQITSGISDPKN